MNRIGPAVLGVLLAVSYGHGACLAAAQATPQSLSAKVIGHGAFPVKVTKTLDSNKLKDGDVIEVETTGSFKLPDGMLVPKGSKVLGRVTRAKAHAKGDPESELGIAFDRVSIAKDKSLNIMGQVQAVFPPADEPDPGMPSSTMSKGGTAVGTAGPGGTAPSVPLPDYKPGEIRTGSNTESSRKPEAAADPKSEGVQGMHDLQLGEGGVLSSKGKQVKLGSGVRMIVHADILELPRAKL